MLNKIRTRHSRKILWALSVIIIISFTLWEGASFIQKRSTAILGKINGDEITAADFDYCYKMAQIRFLLFSPADKQEKITQKEINSQAWQYLLLLSKVKKDNINVDDEEVVEVIRNMFSTEEEQFSKERYFGFLKKYRLRVEPRIFEEYFRQFIQIDKLFDKYAKVEVSEEEVKDRYSKDTQKAKINHIFIPFEKFNGEITVNREEVEKFYDENKEMFKEEAKVKLRYVVINKDDEKFNDITLAAAKTVSIEGLKNQFSLEVKETGFLGINDPIEGLGWNPQLNKEAFTLEKGNLSPPININTGMVIIEKADEKETYLPALEQIKEKVVDKVKESKTKEKAEQVCKDLLVKIKEENITDLKKTAKGLLKYEFKETDFFKYYDYIEGMGMDDAVSEIIFKLNKDEIYSQPIIMLKGAYIIQLVEKTDFDENDYKEKKQTHYDALFQQRSFMKRIQFLSSLGKELKLEIYGTP